MRQDLSGNRRLSGIIAFFRMRLCLGASNFLTSVHWRNKLPNREKNHRQRLHKILSHSCFFNCSDTSTIPCSLIPIVNLRLVGAVYGEIPQTLPERPLKC
jgi:hypothetical protein